MPLVDAVATHDAASGRSAVFLVNRDVAEPARVTIDVSALGDVSVVEARTLSDEDTNARNTLAEPERVGLVDNDSVERGEGTLTVVLPPVSWTVIELAR